MIIVDNEPHSPSKARAQAAQASSAASNSDANADTDAIPERPPLASLDTQLTAPPPPAYSSSPPNGSYYGPATPLVHNAQWLEHAGARAARKRFLKAFVVAVALFILLNAIGQIITLLAGGYSRPRKNRGRHGSWQANCFSADTTTISFDFPVEPKGEFYVGSLGRYGTGTVTFTQSNSKSDRALVTIKTRYSDTGLGVASAVCLIATPPRFGFGFNTPDEIGFSGSMKFDVTVSLPKAPHGQSNLVISSFTTMLPHFVHEFKSLQHVHFENLTIHSSNAEIWSDSLSVTSGMIHTSNADIEGSFHVSDRLVLETSNAPVNVDIEMTNGDTGPTVATLYTTNSPLTASFVLDRPHKDATGGNYVISADTSNNPLTLRTSKSPLSSALTLTGTTSNGAATVSLDPAFEGRFDVATTNNGVVIDDGRSIEDPSGHRRTRKSNVSSVKNGKAVTGEMWWGTPDESTGRGDIRLRSTNGPAQLFLNRGMWV